MFDFEDLDDRAQEPRASDYSFLFDDEEGGSVDGGDATTSRPMSRPSTPPAVTSSSWTCLRCGSSSSVWDLVVSSWRCTRCRDFEFFDSRQPTRHEGATGTWMYIPHGTPESLAPESQLSHRRRRRPRRRRHGPPDPEPDFDPEEGEGYGEEQAESETLTHDPAVEVTPVTSLRTPLRMPSDRAQPAGQPDGPGRPGPHGDRRNAGDGPERQEFGGPHALPPPNDPWSAWLICLSVEVGAVVTTLLPRLGQATWAPLGA